MLSCGNTHKQNVFFYTYNFDIMCNGKGISIMYKVIKMYGDFEPWWFLDGWEEDVVSRGRTNVTRMHFYFQKEMGKLSESFPQKKWDNGGFLG